VLNRTGIGPLWTTKRNNTYKRLKSEQRGKFRHYRNGLIKRSSMKKNSKIRKRKFFDTNYKDIYLPLNKLSSTPL